MNAYNSEEDIIQNLKDTGCNSKQIQELIELYSAGKIDKIYSIMESYRNKVLNNIHKNEKQIECIDYFIYQMERGEKNGK